MFMKIKNCTICFPSLNVPQKKNNPLDADKYGARFFLDKEVHSKEIGEILAFINACRDKVVTNPSADAYSIAAQRDSVKTTFTDGDLNPNIYTQGKYYFDARNTVVIPLFDLYGEKLHDYRVVKNNSIVNILIKIGYVQRFKRVTFYLNGVQYIKEGAQVNIAGGEFEDESKNHISDIDIQTHING